MIAERVYTLPPKARPIEDRFWEKVRMTKSGCWYWTGAKGEYGYGVFGITIDGKWVAMRAHRVAFWLDQGYWPEVVRHSCNRGHLGCVRPSHLLPGTQLDNVNDMIERGTFFSPRKVTREVLEVIDNIVSWLPNTANEIASKFNISPITVRVYKRKRR